MQKVNLFLCFILICVASAKAEKLCFLAKENNQIIKQQGNCRTRHSPCSTFRIVLSLMGYDSKILHDETHPVWLFKKGYPAYSTKWEVPHYPSLWIENSCLWYSQAITRKLGIEKFTDYIVRFNYGNQDVSGDKGKNNGLTNAWLSSSLEISPEEQLLFLQKLLEKKLPISLKAHEMTKSIIFIKELSRGWQLYGKTGSGKLLNTDRTKKLDIKHGWFIGWIEKNERTIIFVTHIIDDKKQDTYAGLRAKAKTIEELLKLIEEVEK